jgi:hypothetical protein
LGENHAPNQFDRYTGRPFAEWPRVLQAVAIVTCLHGHDEALTDEFLNEEIDRLGLMEMSDGEISEFRARHLLNHLN